MFLSSEKRNHNNDRMDCYKDRYYPSLAANPIQMNSIHHNNFARTFPPPYFRLSSLAIQLGKMQ